MTLAASTVEKALTLLTPIVPKGETRVSVRELTQSEKNKESRNLSPSGFHNHSPNLKAIFPAFSHGTMVDGSR